MPSITSNRILKAEATRGLGTGIIFNYLDLQHRCDVYMEQARQRAAQIIEESRVESQTIREHIFAEAKSAALQDAMKQAESEVETRVAALAEQQVAERPKALLPAMRQAADDVSREYDRWLAEWEATAVRLCVEIAEKLVRHELDVAPGTAKNMIAEALRLAAGQPRIVLRLNPSDVHILGDNADAFVKSVTSCGEVVLLADDAIETGGCKVETQLGEIDARLPTLLERITAELTASSTS